MPLYLGKGGGTSREQALWYLDLLNDEFSSPVVLLYLDHLYLPKRGWGLIQQGIGPLDPLELNYYASLKDIHGPLLPKVVDERGTGLPFPSLTQDLKF